MCHWRRLNDPFLFKCLLWDLTALCLCRIWRQSWGSQFQKNAREAYEISKRKPCAEITARECVLLVQIPFTPCHTTGWQIVVSSLSHAAMSSCNLMQWHFQDSSPHNPELDGARLRPHPLFLPLTKYVPQYGLEPMNTQRWRQDNWCPVHRFSVIPFFTKLQLGHGLSWVTSSRPQLQWVAKDVFLSRAGLRWSWTHGYAGSSVPIRPIGQSDVTARYQTKPLTTRTADRTPP